MFFIFIRNQMKIPREIVLVSMTLWVVVMFFLPVGVDLITNPGDRCPVASSCTVLANGTVIYDDIVTICTAQPNTNYPCIWYTGNDCPTYFYCTNDSINTNIRIGWIMLTASLICLVIPFILMCFSN